MAADERLLPRGSDPRSDWAWALPVLWGVLLWLLAVNCVLRAAPVPERAPIEGKGTRGLPELRDASAAVVSLDHLLRSCVRCHGMGKANTALFDERGRLNGRATRDRLAWGVGVVLNSKPVATWYPKEEDRADLGRALSLLPRR